MGKIRSAWEIALERTEGIEVDRAKAARAEAVKAARALAGAYLSGDEPMGPEELKAKYEAISDKEAAKEGMTMAVLQNFTLPLDPPLAGHKEKVLDLVSLVAGEEAIDLAGQVLDFTARYPEHREQLYNELKKRYEPTLRGKEEQMREKYGQEVRLSAEQDQEFIKLAQQQLDALAQQYNAALADAKKNLEALVKG